MYDEGKRSRRFAIALSAGALLVGVAVIDVSVGPVVPAHADQEVSTFSAGSEPVQVAVTPDGKAVYVVNEDSDSMTRYDTVLGSTGTTTALGSKPAAVAVSPDGSTVVVADFGDDVLRLYSNSASPTFEQAIGVDDEPDGLAFGPGGADLYVSAYGANKLDVVSMASRTVVHRYSVGAGPVGVAVAPNGVWAVVAAESAGVVDQITLADGAVDAGTIDGEPRGVAISPDSRYAYVSQEDYDQVRALDLQAHGWLAGAAAVGGAPSSVAISPDGGLLYVADSGSSGGSGDVAVVSAASLQRVRTITVDGAYPDGLAVSSDGTRYYATLLGSNTTEVFRAQPWGPDPTIAGSARVGAILKAVPGSWAPAATELDYQWYAGGAPLGADAATLHVPKSALGKKITLTVSGSVPGEQVYTASTTTHAVAKGRFTHPRLRFTGALKVGRRLTARPGAWSPTARLTYQWYVAGRRVAGATHRTWRITRSARHRKVTLKITARRAGYLTTTVARTSKRVR